MTTIPANSRNKIIDRYPAISKYNIREVQSKTDSTGTNFFARKHTFELALNENEAIIPNKSYVRMRLTLQKSSGTDLAAKDGIALAMNAPAVPFIRSELKYGETIVDMIEDHGSRIDTIVKRTTNNQSWMETNANWMQSGFAERLEKTTSTTSGGFEGNQRIALSDIVTGFGATTQVAVSGQDLDFTVTSHQMTDLTKWLPFIKEITVSTAANSVTGPLLSITDDDQIVLGAGSLTDSTAAVVIIANCYITLRDKSYVKKVSNSVYDLYYFPTMSQMQLATPLHLGSSKYTVALTTRSEAEIRRYLVESLADVSGTGGYYFAFQDIRAMFFTFYGDFPTSHRKYYDVSKYKLIPVDINKSTTSKTIDVDPKMSTVMVAFGNKHTDTTEPLNIFDTTSYNIFDNISHLQGKYAGVLYPQERYQFGTGSNDDGLERMYKDNNQSLNKETTEYNENFSDFKKRGMFMVMPINDDQATSSTFELNFDVNETAVPTNIDILVFTVHKETLEVNVKDGRMTSAIKKAF